MGRAIMGKRHSLLDFGHFGTQRAQRWQSDGAGSMEFGEVRLTGRLDEIYLIDNKTLFSWATGSMKMAEAESEMIYHR